jgi:hypothetical protein
MSDTTPAAPAPAPAAGSEEAGLLALAASDQATFEFYRGKDGTEKTGAERLVELRQARDAGKAEEIGGDDIADDDDSAIDLDAADGDDADADDSEDAAAGEETTVKPIGPGDDATDDELDAWRAEHGVPDDPADYEAPEVEGVEWDFDALAPILQIAHDHNLPAKPIADALAAYGERVKAQQAEIRQRDRELAKALRSELSEAEIAAVKSAAKAMPAELRTMLNTARLPDGTRLVNQPDLLRMIASTYGTGREHQAAPQRQDHRTMLQQELAELSALRDRNIDEYWKPWRTTGKSGSERVLEIMRELGDEGPAKPNASDLRAEEQELVRLSKSDPARFSYGSWPDARSPADRLHAIRMGRG